VASSAWRFAAKLAVLVAFGGCAAAGGQGAAWLDRSPPTNWNAGGTTLPAAPVEESALTSRERCAATVRRATTADDDAVQRAGWALIGPLQTFSGTTIITGTSGFDGMCRPVRYQLFAFVDGTFAGTLSPVFMTSRTDGAQSRLYLYRAGELAAEFLRYTDADPLCCPSRVTRVEYRVERDARGPVLVPVNASTTATSK
jgi:hypothetical protein